MEYNTNTPRTSRTIAGRSVTVIQPYAEGHALTEAEAAMLNQTLAENFSNNLRKRIEDGVTDADGNKTRDYGESGDADADLQALVDSYMTEYQPGVRSGGGGAPRVTDPVEKEARKLARQQASDYVKSQGMKVGDVDLPAITAALFDANRDLFMKQGAAVVAATQKAVKFSEGADLFEGIAIQKKAEAPAEAPTE